MEKTAGALQKKSPEQIKKEIDDLAKKAKNLAIDQIDLFADIMPYDEEIDGYGAEQLLGDISDPEGAYRYYYGIRSLLIANLPKGAEFKKLRKYIYDEKNLYLNRGMAIAENGVRGSDGRMTYKNPILSEAFDVVVKWIARGANPYDIYDAFYQLNVHNGYR